MQGDNVCFSLAAAGCVVLAAAARDVELLRLCGMSDASAAVAVDGNRVLVASDEDNTLRLYRLDARGLPAQQFPWDVHLKLTDREHPEGDIEAVARAGDRLYWIASHGRNKNGKWRANRHRFFATDIEAGPTGVVLRPVGTPCADLMRQMLRDPKLGGLGLAEAVGIDTAENAALAPKRGGVNIEGLAATPDGKTLLIGFRNPCPNRKALIVPLLNADAVLERQAAPEFGEPILLDLDGLGVRDMTYSARLGAYLIVAGPSDETPRFRLFTWSGEAAAAPVAMEATGELDVLRLSPEAVVAYPGSDSILLLSDDGALEAGEASPKASGQPSFRGVRIPAAGVRK
jgi:hypothetical protein